MIVQGTVTRFLPWLNSDCSNPEMFKSSDILQCPFLHLQLLREKAHTVMH